MRSRVLVVVVLYEIEVGESQTLQRLAEIKCSAGNLPEVLLFDNSRANREVNARLFEHYYHCPNNVGVGGAYNYSAELAAQIGKDVLVFFDHDTNVNSTYFDSLYSALGQNPEAGLFCPTILAGKKIISPTYYFFHRPFFYSTAKTGVHHSKWFTVLNSGLAVRLHTFNNLNGYDKDLSLDYSDHYFFWKYKKHNSQFVIFDCANDHNLSGISDHNFASVLGRFKKYHRATGVYCRKVKSVFPFVWLFVRSLKLTLLFRRFDFIKFILFQK